MLRRRSSAGAVERQERTAAVHLSLAALMAGGQAPGDETSALSGSLADVAVAQVLRRLAGRRKSGRLAIVVGRWAGEVWLAAGRVVAARCGAEQGLEALDAVTLAVALAPGSGTFSFEETGEVPPGQLDQPLSAEQAAARIEAVPVDHLAAVVRDPAAVPRVRQPERERAGRVGWPASGGWESSPPPEALDPPTLRLLFAVDGARTVEQLVQRFGLARTARGLAKLWVLGLVDGGSLPAAQAAADGTQETR